MDPRTTPPLWLRILVRIDFSAAVALTVVAPLALTAGALPPRLDARQPSELVPQPPPRNKRSVPVAGPVGLVSGLEA